MLEKPDIQDSRIIDCLRGAYELDALDVEFLPLGADRDTAVYRAITASETYFVKLRRGGFKAVTVLIPALLHEQGMRQIIAPLKTRSGQLWTGLENYTLTVSPFVAGKNGYEVALSDARWIEFGQTMRAMHDAELPPALRALIPREDFSGDYREAVRRYQSLAADSDFSDPVSVQLLDLLNHQRERITLLVNRAETLAAVMQSEVRPLKLCHGDIHAGNVLIENNNHFYIVDMDTLILAPVARDLMFVGGGQFGSRRSPAEEEQLFYRGYGAVEPDRAGLAYYRYERIVQDIAAFCEEILSDETGEQDRRMGLYFLSGQFQPGAVIDIALHAEDNPPESA